MSYLRVIERLENLLHMAAEIIRLQTELLQRMNIPQDKTLQTLQERFEEEKDKWC